MPIKITEEQLFDAPTSEAGIKLTATKITEEQLQDSQKTTDGFGLSRYFDEVKESLVGGEEAITFADTLDKAYQNSIAGLLVRGKEPDPTVPGESPILQTVVGAIAEEVLNLPATAAGFIAGGRVGGPVGAFGGAVGLPLGIRAALIESYRTGEINTFSDFWDIATAFTVEGGKGTLVGLAGGKAGQIVKGGAVKLLASTSLSGKAAATAVATTEGITQIGTMITAGAALEGRIPDRSEFINVAATVLGVKAIASTVQATAKLTNTLKDTYLQTDKRPVQVARDMQTDPTIKEDILGGVVEPRSYRDIAKDQPLAAVVKKKPEPKLLEISEASKKVRSKIVNLKDVERLSKAPDIVTTSLDFLAPIKRAIKQTKDIKVVEETSNAYTKLRLLAGSQARVADVLQNGVADFKDRSKRVSKGFSAIVKPVQKDIAGLDTFLVALRTPELEARNVKTGIDLAAAKKVIKEVKPEIAQAAKELRTFNKGILQNYADSGMLSKKGLLEIEAKNEFFAPFHRAIEDDLGRVGGASSSLLKAIKGSERDIISPVQTMVKNAEALLRRADQNKAMQALVSDLEGTVFLKKKRATKAIVKEGEFVASTPAQLGKNDIEVFFDGKRKVFETTPDIKQALDSLRPEEIGLTLKILAFPARIKRIGITNALTFGLTNFIRGDIASSINSVNHYIPIVDGVIGLGSLLTAKRGLKKVAKGEKLNPRQNKYVNLFTEWVQEGGMGSALIEMDRAYLKTGVQDVLTKSKIRNEVGLTPASAASAIGRAVIATVKTPLRALENISLTFENAPRFREFALSKKADLPADVAALSAREVAVDFAKRGTSKTLQTIRLTNAFTGARINSGDKFVRQMINKPLQTAARTAVWITIPSIALHLMNHYERDDEGNWKQMDWYRIQQKYQKDLYNLIRIGEGDDAVIMRVPRAFDLGVMAGRAPELFFDFLAEKDPEVFGEMADAVGKNFGGGLIEAFLPDALSPFVEAGINRSLFTDSPLIPRGQEGLVAEMQATPYTTQLAKAIAKPVSRFAANFNPEARTSTFVSAAALDNYVRQWTGILGTSALKTVDEVLQAAGVLEKKPKTRPSLSDVLGITSDFEDDIGLIDIPIVRAFFVRNPSLSAQPIADFFKTDKRNQAFRRSVKKLEENDPIEAREIMKEAIATDSFIDTTKIRSGVLNVMKIIRGIEQIPDTKMSPPEKRRRIDEITIDLVKHVDAMNKRIKKENKTLKQRLGELE